MSNVIQWEPEGKREARLRLFDDICRGRLDSVRHTDMLDMHHLHVGEGPMQAMLTQLATVSGIQHLDLGFNGLRAPSMIALSESGITARLVSLELDGNHLGIAGITALCEQEFPLLEELGLSWCELNDEAITPITATKAFPKLNTLRLRRNKLTDAGAELLAASDWLRRQLTQLTRDYNDDMTSRGRDILIGAFGFERLDF